MHWAGGGRFFYHSNYYIYIAADAASRANIRFCFSFCFSFCVSFFSFSFFSVLASFGTCAGHGPAVLMDGHMGGDLSFISPAPFSISDSSCGYPSSPSVPVGEKPKKKTPPKTKTFKLFQSATVLFCFSFVT